MKNSKLLAVTAVVTILYCCLCFASAGCVLYGAFCGADRVFQFGNSLVNFWLFDPIPMVLSVAGLVLRREQRGRFLLFAALSAISWLAAGILMATVF